MILVALGGGSLLLLSDVEQMGLADGASTTTVRSGIAESRLDKSVFVHLFRKLHSICVSVPYAEYTSWVTLTSAGFEGFVLGSFVF